MCEVFQQWLDYLYYVNFIGLMMCVVMKVIFNDNCVFLQGELEGEKQLVQIINKGNVEVMNGVVMKIWLVVVLYLGDNDVVIDCVLQICCFMYNNVLVMFGVVVMVVVISEVLRVQINVDSIIVVGIYGV